MTHALTQEVPVRHLVRVCALALACTFMPTPGRAQQPQTQEYSRATRGTRYLESGGLSIKMLVEAANLGGAEVELGEITFPVGSGANRRSHTHGRVEIFYILSGRLDHIVNERSHVLEPGMVGIVRPGDGVVHRVQGDEPVRALVIWAPGGEADRIAPFFEERPLDPPRQ
jgi:mannose-6-phosphate isomerase-like protein (cupin superfamily)